jgi:hypothetical protein
VTRRACASVLALATCLAANACESVPDLTFASADALADGDALDASSDSDAAPPGCPVALPPGASVCCDAVACNGNCGAECPLCLSLCDAGSLCCAHANNVVCRPLGTSCP